MAVSAGCVIVKCSRKKENRTEVVVNRPVKDTMPYESPIESIARAWLVLD